MVIMPLIGTIYYGLWYCLLRGVLRSRLMAMVAILIGIRTQMFLSILVPTVWNEMQASVMRYCYDVGFFWCLWLWIKSQHKGYLWGMMVCCALALYHMPTTGVFLTATGIFLVGINIARMLKGVDQVDSIGAHLLRFTRPLLIVPVLAGLFIYLTVGQHLFAPIFWSNLFEWSEYFAKGFFYSPILSAITNGDTAKVIGGIAYVMLYVTTALFAGYQCWYAKKPGSWWFVLMLSVYGMGLFTYYVGMSHKYFSVGLPGVFIFVFLLDRGLRFLPVFWRQRIPLAILALCCYALVTSTMFRAYPNVLNISRNTIVDERTAIKVGNGIPYFHQLSAGFPSWIKVPVNSLGQTDEGFKYEHDFVNHDALVSYYRMETTFPEDVALINSLTTENDRVALLSSFEVMMLSKADRKPFFYYFPLLNAHPLRMRNFVVTTIFSYPQLQRCLDQLNQAKPEYVFMEKVFLTERVHPWYLEEYEDLINLIRYVKANYEPYSEGKFLIAMKRKPNA